MRNQLTRTMVEEQRALASDELEVDDLLDGHVLRVSCTHGQNGAHACAANGAARCRLIDTREAQVVLSSIVRTWIVGCNYGRAPGTARSGVVHHHERLLGQVYRTERPAIRPIDQRIEVREEIASWSHSIADCRQQSEVVQRRRV